jgi:cyclopropane fatty-acyl-phospholipid synthase-like methyltransferase
MRVLQPSLARASKAIAEEYDELAYRSRPIEWSAPERLALCALLHGGPRAKLRDYRVLELGCGDGANLIPLAFYRPDARFVGVDASLRATTLAESRRRELGLSNLALVHASFSQAAAQLTGPFDYILAHGVFSWVSASERDALLQLCQRLLAPSGLLYFNYNTKPGWNIRGMMRDFLLARTAQRGSLAERTALAQQIAAEAGAALTGIEHPYARLLLQEWRFVAEAHPSYVAHEYLAPENHAYWRSEALALCASHGLHYIADADFNYPSSRIPDNVQQALEATGWSEVPAVDTLDLFCYRQLHSPILSHVQARAPLTVSELTELSLASALQSIAPTHFAHPSGYTVDVEALALAEALRTVAPQWPRGSRIGTLLQDPAAHAEDLTLLHRHSLIDLHITEPSPITPDPRLAEREQHWSGCVTDPYHRHTVTEAESCGK